eukprot:15346445-Ditylum_brightwellii.AAC.1
MMSSPSGLDCNKWDSSSISPSVQSSQHQLRHQEEQHPQQRQHIMDHFAVRKAMNDAMAAGAHAALKSNEDAKMCLPQGEISPDKLKANIEDPNIEFYSSADETPSSISISEDNMSLSDNGCHID